MAWVARVKDRNTGKLRGFKIRYRLGGRGSKTKASEIFEREDEATEHLPRYEAIENSQKKISATREHSLLPLQELVRRYVKRQLHARKIKPEHQNSRIDEVCGMVQECGWITVADVTAAAVTNWKDRKDGRGYRLGAYLRAVLKYAADVLDQPVHPKALLELKPPPPRKSKPIRHSVEEVQAWLEATAPWGLNAYAYVACILFMGQRPISLARLTVSAYTDGALYLNDIKKSGDHQTIPVKVKAFKELFDAITAGRGPDEPLFLDPRYGKGWLETGNRIAPSQWWRAHIDGRKKHGIYNLKYDGATEIGNAVGPEAGRLITGHHSIQQFMVYNTEDQKRMGDSMQKIAKRRPWLTKSVAEQIRRAHGGRTEVHTTESDGEGDSPKPSITKESAHG